MTETEQRPPRLRRFDFSYGTGEKRTTAHFYAPSLEDATEYATTWGQKHGHDMEYQEEAK